MDRAKALELVQPHVLSYTEYGYRAVPVLAIIQLIGQSGLLQLRLDPIRGIGPTDNSIYYWNVVDALQLGYGSKD